jgi:hypothetical protein
MASKKQGEIGAHKGKKKGDRNGTNPRLSPTDMDLILCWFKKNGNANITHG